MHIMYIHTNHITFILETRLKLSPQSMQTHYLGSIFWSHLDHFTCLLYDGHKYTKEKWLFSISLMPFSIIIRRTKKYVCYISYIGDIGVRLSTFFQINNHIPRILTQKAFYCSN